MLDKCPRCERIYSTNTRDATPVSPDRCPECRLPLPVEPPRADAAPTAVAAASRSRWLLILLSGVGLCVAGVAVWQAWFPGRAFDPQLWRDESRMADGVRHDMAVRMLARGTLFGKTRSEVVELLGEPDERDEFHPEPDLLVYRLGPNRPPFPIPAADSEWLSVILGPDGRVVLCKLWED